MTGPRPIPDHLDETDVRCPSCHKLIAKREASGALVIKSRRHIVTVKSGEVSCVRCDRSVAAASAPTPRFTITFDQKEK